jgi:hypothetical protein
LPSMVADIVPAGALPDDLEHEPMPAHSSTSAKYVRKCLMVGLHHHH